MGSFGIDKHAHIDAAVAAGVLTALTYCAKWVFGIELPDLILYLPPFIVIFAFFYIALYIVFLIAWSLK